MAEFRKLLESEIEVLVRNGCFADNWDNILVADGFVADRVILTRFSGSIKIGAFGNTFSFPGGVPKMSGLYHVSLHNVEIGDNCCIENVSNCISNYRIGNDCFISNVDVISTDCLSSFGNGVEASVLNETGGHEVMIYDKLSSHQAYLMAMYRHRPQFVAGLKDMVRTYSQSISSTVGTIGNNVTIIDTGIIKNVKIGDYSYIEAASRLCNGSINSTAESPVFIGTGAMAEDFILCSGSVLKMNATIQRCFVGQACVLTDTYSASDSLFFSNFFGANGEACAIFAGPFTVSHHKSTLLIAGLFSFMNAGSGSNQSNHLYKLGPVHYGTLGRGSKTTSDSYILWPAKAGAFSLVMGRHTSHFNTRIFPFAYIIENHSSTYIFPGANLKSVGTIRDAKKWPVRDKRKGEMIDSINFNLLSPYTMQDALAGLSELKNMYSNDPQAEIYKSGECLIKASSLAKGIKLYSIMADKFLGNSLISRIMKSDFSDIVSLRKALEPDSGIGRGDWQDLSGLIAPVSEIEKLIFDIENGTIPNLAAVSERLTSLHTNYYSYEWTWAYDVIKSHYGVDLSVVTVEELKKLIVAWKDSVVELDNLLISDAAKEISLSSMMEFSGRNDKERMENDPFVQSVLKHIESKSALFAEVLNRISFEE